MSYSNGGGGTLHLPSPTHVHNVDVTSAVRSLRRSLSRSPSKFRLVTKKSPSSSPKSPLSPSPLSPQKRATLQYSTTPTHTPSPLAVPFPPSARLSLRGSATRSKTAPVRASSRTRTSPRSPIKRALSQTPGSGNTPPSYSLSPGAGQENNASARSPTAQASFERLTREKSMFTVEITAPVNHALSRLGGDGCCDSLGPSSATSSPLKRSDAIMNLDQASLGSPVAKRRSLHGSSHFGSDFNVFDHGPPSTPHFEIHDEQGQEYQLSSCTLAPPTNTDTPGSAFSTSMPRRSSSLRKSTLQQRHGDKKTSWERRARLNARDLSNHDLSSLTTELSTPGPSKNRPRLSLDQFLPPMARDSPFSSQGNLPNASMHMVNQPNITQATHQPHPLSRTMTQSSSNSSIVDESPTHVPVNFGDHPRPRIDFSKSLPAGALRPFALQAEAREETMGGSSGSFSTPQNYKLVKPLPAAFMSTGLISKVNRNPEQPQVVRGTTKSNMPDTPCKRPPGGFPTMPTGVPGSAIAKARHIRHSFGAPSTPFNLHGTQPAPGTFGRGLGMFGSSFGNSGIARRDSFASNDGDDVDSPEPKGDAFSSMDYELPPTPTKQAPLDFGVTGSGKPYGLRSLPASISAVGYGPATLRTSSKLNLFTSTFDVTIEESQALDLGESPTTADLLPAPASIFMASFSQSRAARGIINVSPAPLRPRSLTLSVTPSRKLGFAKISHVAPASPLQRIDFMERLSPRTPQESILPPDPSGLSISNHRDRQVSKDAGGHRPMLPPATPTMGQDYFQQMGDRRLSLTPVNGFSSSNEIDDVLHQRFEKVELIGSGEFSNVYKVTQPAQLLSLTQSFYFATSGSPLQSRSPTTPLTPSVFAVKKSRQPFQGTRDRQRKLQEVQVLKALGHSDHVVHLIDSWEEKNHLYIQTEFCEEGTLDLFLSQVGRKARLDDFRIWKILLELAQACQYHSLWEYPLISFRACNISMIPVTSISTSNLPTF